MKKLKGYRGKIKVLAKKDGCKNYESAILINGVIIFKDKQIFTACLIDFKYIKK